MNDYMWLFMRIDKDDELDDIAPVSVWQHTDKLEGTSLEHLRDACERFDVDYDKVICHLNNSSNWTNVNGDRVAEIEELNFVVEICQF